MQLTGPHSAGYYIIQIQMVDVPKFKPIFFWLKVRLSNSKDNVALVDNKLSKS